MNASSFHISSGMLVVTGALLVGALGCTRDTGTGDSAASSTETAGAFQLQAKLNPDPPAQRGNALEVRVRDAAGQPVSGAKVQIQYRMPAMGAMPEMKGEADVRSSADGTYVGRFDLPMAGGWTMHVAVDANGKHGQADYGLTVGSAGLVPIGGESETAGAPGAITLNASERANAGVRTEAAVRAPLSVTTRALGQVKVDETKLTDVTLRVPGYIQKLEVDQTGQAVKKGQVLFTLYSPELFAAEQELLVAARAQSSGMASALIGAAKEKLRLWGMTDAQVAQVIRRGTPLERVPFLSPATGAVLQKDVVEGASVQAGQRLYRIAPLDPIWVEARVYERDLPTVHLGQVAKVTLSALAGRTFEGKVTFVSPTLDGATRTATVRVELRNPDLSLKPEMFADVLLARDLGERLQIPSSAVLYTGKRRIVFVDEGHGRLVPRDVVLGAQTAERAEVLSGLREGDQVVTRGNFLVAAESRLQATSFWAEPQDAGTPGQAR